MSYSQSGEDKYLIDKYLGAISPENQAYIELGALDGIRYSNTKMLEDELGWTGILIEPHPTAYTNLERNRPNNILVNAVVSDFSSEVEFNYFENENLAAVSSVAETLTEGLKTKWFEKSEQNVWLNGQINTNLRRKKIKPVPLSAIISETTIQQFGFLSLDVEGHELSVLQSYDWSRPIDYILVEENGNVEIRRYLIQKGYSHLEDIANNSLYKLNGLTG